MEKTHRRVGIAISTRNRPELLAEAIGKWREFSPKGTDIIVVDDFSVDPYPYASFVSDHQLGIARIKNICIDLLLARGCTDLFLADDDVYPTDSEGIRKYLDSGQNHMSMSFDHRADGRRISSEVYVKYKYPDLWTYNSPCGCLLYFKRKVVEGGLRYDGNFGLWGMEHKDFSLRVHKAGLTPHPFMDIPDSITHFYSHDYHMTAESSVPEEVRIAEINRNMEYFKRKHG